MATDFETIIGLEVHVQLKTATKIFCRCKTDFGAPPNTQVCPVCLGMPGALPVLNERAVEFAIALGLATHCNIAERSIFARKNYFYPDLPKGYQISQFERPLCEKGWIEIDLIDENSTKNEQPAPKRIGITRIHMEEDAGKLQHGTQGESYVDLNRACTPLLEIVSEPDMRTAKEAGSYMRAIHKIVRYLDICDGNMEEGSLRCDANISIRPRGQEKFGTKVELKNINSFRFVEKAIEYEIGRQKEVLDEGGKIVQETRLYDSEKNITRSMRSKEEAHDYRYFPDPDLLPLDVNEAWKAQVKSTLPELARDKRERFTSQFKLPFYDADLLTQERDIAEYFEATLQALQSLLGSNGLEGQAKLVSNWVMGEVLRTLKEKKLSVSQTKMTPSLLASLLHLIQKGTISGPIAKEVFLKMFDSGKEAAQIVKEEGLEQVSDSGAIEEKIKEIMAAFPKELQEYKSGKDKLFGFFVGQVMKAMKGKANPQVVNDVLKKFL